MGHLKKTLCLTLILPLLMSCRSKERVVGRNQDNFPVVSEGSAAGVSSTIAAPGESPLLVTTQTVPLTGTNVDTTTSFTLPAVTTTDGMTVPNVASSLPAYPGSTSTVAPPRRRRIPVEQTSATTSTRETTAPREKAEDPAPPVEPAGAVSTDTIEPSPPPPPATETSGGREPAEAPVTPEPTSTQ